MKSKPAKEAVEVARSEDARPAQSGTGWWLHAAVVFLLLLANFALYFRTLHQGFLSVDDPDYIQNNPLLGGLNITTLKQILSEPYFANYAPVNILSYAVDIALARGKNPFAIHLSNVLWNGWVIC